MIIIGKINFFSPVKLKMAQTNSKDFECPARMSDARMFTSWRPRSSTQYFNMVYNNMPDAYSYRQYMTQNAEELIKRNAAEAYLKAACGPCDDNYDRGHMLGENDQQVCNSRVCTFRTTDPFGLGRGRMYTDEMDGAAKKAFLEAKKKEQEWFKQKEGCCGANLDDMLYFPIDGKVQSDYGRYSVPSGASLMSGGRVAAQQ